MKLIFVLTIVYIIIHSIDLNAQKNDSEIFLHAQSLYDNNKFKQAVSIFSELISKGEVNPEYFLARAKCYSKLLKVNEAFNDFNKAVKHGNYNSKYYLERGLFLLGFTNQFTEAIDNFSMAKNYSESDSMTYKCLYHRASTRSQIRDFDNAYRDFQQAYKLRNSSVELLNDMALLYHSLGKSDSALIFLKSILKNDSTQCISYHNIGFIYGETGEFSKALESFQCYVNLKGKENSSFFNNRGYVKFKIADKKGALKDINKSIQLDKTNAYAYRNRALVFIELGKIKKACSDLNSALKFNFTQQYGEEVVKLYNTHCK